MTYHKTALFLLLLVFNTIAQQSPYIVAVDSISGRAEIQRESKVKWQFLRSGEKVNNNDVIRTLSNGHLRLKWFDSSFVYADRNTQFQINLLPGNKKEYISQITVYSGSLFLIINNTARKDHVNRFSVFSPFIAASPHNASFLINVNQNRSSEIKIVQGAFEIRNINNNEKTYVGSSFKAVVLNRTDQIQKSALLQEDLDSLRKWIPVPVIERLMEEQLLQARRAYQIINGKLEDKCLLTLFDNKTDYSGPWNISKKFPLFFAQRLQLANKHLRSEIIDTVVSDPSALASLKKARFLITGQILSFDIIQHAEISAQADEYRELRIARVRLQLTITETQVNQKLLEKIFTGEIAQKRKKENSWEAVHHLPFDLQDESFATSIIGQAVVQVLDQIAETMVQFLDM